MDKITLDQAPDQIKLAVDLIQLLEEAKIPTKTAILALEIVLKDLRTQA